MGDKGRLSFYDEIKRNKRNSYLLVVGILFLLILLSVAISFSVDRAHSFSVLIIGTIISVVYVVISYSKSSQIAIASVGAKKASRRQYRTYHDVVEGVAIASGLPKPELYVMDNPQINAFATGKDPDNAIICFTSGALERLDKQELEGVVAHEMSHIANYDIRFMTTVAVVVGLVSIISQVFLRSLWFGSGGRDNRNPIFLVIAVVLAILTPILVLFVQMAISRKREYAADSSAVKFTRTPTGLVNALKKIKSDNRGSRQKSVPNAISPLFIRKPFRASEWLSTHPPIDKRIETLKRM